MTQHFEVIEEEEENEKTDWDIIQRERLPQLLSTTFRIQVEEIRNHIRWVGRSGQKADSKHLIDLVDVFLKSMKAHPYRARSKRKEPEKADLRCMLKGNAEAPITEWASPIVFAARKEWNATVLSYLSLM